MRLRSLDSLRGVAAVVVMMSHGVRPLTDSPQHTWLGDAVSYMALTPLRIFINGPAAVLIFFVLSGLVLSFRFIETPRVAWAPFALTRLLRIWPPFALAILGSALLMLLVGNRPLPELGDWFNDTWRAPLGLSNLATNLLMLQASDQFDNPMWSLVDEIRISMIFPALVFVTRSKPYTATFSTALLTIGCASVIGHFSMNGIPRSILDTTGMVFPFVIGIIIAINLKYLQDILDKYSNKTIIILWILAIISISFAPIDISRLDNFSNGALAVMSVFWSAVIIVLCTMRGPFYRILVSPIPTFLGRVSYSLYLWHVIIITATIRLAHNAAPLPVLILVGMAISLVIADLSQRYIEVPFIRIGRRLADQADNHVRTLKPEPVSAP